MSSDVASTAVGARAVRSERQRVLNAMLADMDLLVERQLQRICEEIPAYAAQDERFLDDVRDQITRHNTTKLSLLLSDREVSRADTTFTRGAAMRRARAGFALEDYINAFRAAQQEFWDAVVTYAGDAPEGREVALSLVAPLLRYCDFVSTQAGHAYVEYQQYAVADADRERRDLLERLLTGELPPRGPLAGAAAGFGLGADAQMMVAVATPAGPGVNGDAAHAATAAITLAGSNEAKTLVVVRQSEIIAVPALPPGTTPAALCDRLEAAQRRLCAEGIALAVGISTVAAGVAELPRAYLEAQAARDAVAGGGGVVALPRYSPLDYLALRADGTARRLVDPRLRAFLDADRARGGVLVATVRAFADADLNLRVAAERLQVHPNTARYRLRRITERTGRNPRRTADLVDLLVGIALDGANGGQPAS